MIFKDVLLIEKIYIITSLITGLGSLFLSIFVLSKNKKSPINRSYFLVGVSIALWSLSLFACHISPNKNLSLFWNRLLHFGSIFIPITFYRFTLILLDHKKEKNILLKIGYFLCLFLICIVFTPLIVKDLQPKFSFRLWPVPGSIYMLYLSYFSFYSYYSLWLVFREYLKSTGIRRGQLKFIFIGLFIGFSGGSTNFAYFYNLPIPPVGNFFVFLYLIFLAYAIVKYRLMDVNIAITRVTIFVFVYTLVLGIPFYLGFKLHLWQHSTWLMLILATAGPYIYLFLQKRAEKQIFQEEHRYRQVLREASYGMIHIKETDKLANLIVHIISKSVRTNNCLMFLLNKETGHFELKASRDEEEISRSFKFDSKLIKYIEGKKEPIVCEELKQKNLNTSDDSLREIIEEMDGFKSELILPMLSQDKLFALIMIGKKKSGKIFTQDDIIVFTILANQVGIAIENCLYWEEAKKRMREEDFQARVASLDMMASSFAHEIDNPIQGIIGQVECLNDDLEACSSVVPADRQDSMKKSFDYVLTNVKRISDMIKSILEYSRMTSGELVKVSIYDVVDSFENLMKPQFKAENVKYNKEIESNLPAILAEKIQIEELLMNFAANSIHAVRNSKDKNVNLKISRKSSNEIRIEFSDNGYGIPDKLIKDIFLASVTTKGSSEGTGLGLYRCRRIIDAHKGKLWAESEGKDKGATMIVELTIFDAQDKRKNSLIF